MKVLLIGYGCELRGDDAVGQLIARTVAEWHRPDLRCLAVPSLVPELCAEMSQADGVLFVDAGAVSEVGISELRGRRCDALGHTSDPANLLALTEVVYDRKPRAWLVTVPAREFEPGLGLSALAQAGVAAALARIETLLNKLALQLLPV
jgi:hydrogenase maturation protease